MDDKLISFVIPCYHSEKTLAGVIEELGSVMHGISGYQFEVVLVNDGSGYETFNVIKELCNRNSNIIGINLSKNFGQHAALMAGFHYVKGEIVICLDDDGQMPLESVVDLVSEINNGADAVFGKYEEKKHSFFRNLGTKINFFMCRYLLNKPDKLYMSSFWGAKRFLIEEMINYSGAYPFITGLILRSSNNFVNIPVSHRLRESGKSNYSFLKLFSLWMNGFTAFSVKPLRIATVCGLICSIGGFGYGIWVIIQKIIHPDILVGYSSIITLLLFIGGILMLMLGLIGEYVGRIYICINNSPQYVIKEKINVNETE